MADEIRLTDLEVIQRWSIAVRGETADRAELAAALRADLAWVEGGRRPKAAAAAPQRPAPAEPADDLTSRRTPSATSRPAAAPKPTRTAAPAKPARTAAKPAKAAKAAAKTGKAAAKGKPAARSGRR